jgi:hypothetical protein
MKLKTELKLMWLGIHHYLLIILKVSRGILSYFVNVFGGLFFYFIFIPFILLPSEIFQNIKAKKKMEEERKKEKPILTPEQEEYLQNKIDAALKFKK